jgi:hypothetical protein
LRSTGASENVELQPQADLALPSGAAFDLSNVIGLRQASRER